ncbi:spermidine synthase [Nonomuraea maheshkhaliensis]|uniref:Polyamine aminopropyltransferase n=1 Tax=Nonomuraea maheshkhaliensis TaxID=419590 RepID=A0ABP4QJ43_9ACTN
MTRYITEPLAPGLTRTWTVSEVLYEARTPYQHMLIGRTEHGITLFSGDIDAADVMERQSAEKGPSQLVYHEALMVPALALAGPGRTPVRDRVLIVGSSEGVATQMARDAGAALIDHVDIDLECVQACARHLPYGYTPAEVDAALAGEDRVRLHIEDGLQFVEARLKENHTLPAEERTHYDVIVIDVQDEHPTGGAQHNRLYTRHFLQRCKDLLTADGVLSTQAGSFILWQQETLRATLKRYSDVFPSILCYSSWEHGWTFVTGKKSASASPLPTLLQRRLASLSYQPATLDALSAASATILPFHARPAVSPATGPIQEP